MRMHLWPLWWLACAAIGAAASSETSGGQEVKNVAIIGAGAAGASAAYHLQRYAEEEGLAINITVFERTDHVGGRTLTVNAYDSPSEPIEQGASIFVTVNHILYNATQRFGLPLGTMGTSEPGDVTAIWDGARFVYESAEGASWWRDAARMVWRYGSSPYYAVRLVKNTVGTFLKLYEEPWFPFRSLTQRVFELGLARVAGMTGEQFLAENKINPQFSRHIIQAATRVNYAANLAYIHGLEAMVSFATDGAVSVIGGNWQIFENMVQHSGAAVYRNTTVASVSYADKSHPGLHPKYAINTRASGASSTEVETSAVTFDNIIIAAPWQYAGITADNGVVKHKIDDIPYVKLHVTLFTSPFKLRPGFFGLEPGAKAPSNVYTTLAEDEQPKMHPEGVGKTGFYSISTLRTIDNPETQRLEYVYKIFSAEPITADFLSDLLGAQVPQSFTTPRQEAGGAAAATTSSTVDPISWYRADWFHSYPIELPRVTFQDPVVGSGVYYTSGIESFISTMETSALMGMNVARLIADDFAGVKRADDVQEDATVNDGEAARQYGAGEL